MACNSALSGLLKNDSFKQTIVPIAPNNWHIPSYTILLFSTVIYLTCTMALGTVSVCLTVLVLNLHHRDVERPVPRWMRILFLKYLAAIICVHARKPKTMAGNLLFESPDNHKSGSINIKSGLRRIARDAGLLRPMLTGNGEVSGGMLPGSPDHRYTMSDQVYPGSKATKLDKTHEWKEIAHVLDRLFFWIVFIFMSASALIILLVPLYKDKLSGDSSEDNGWYHVLPTQHLVLRDVSLMRASEVSC